MDLTLSLQVRNANPAQQYQNMMMQGGQPGRAFRPFSKIWRVALNVCGKAFIGQGKTKQNARNMAAKNALDVCREELLLKSQKNMMMQTMMGNAGESAEERYSFFVTIAYVFNF